MLDYVKKFTIFALISAGASFILFLFFGNTNPAVNSFYIANKNSELGVSGISQPVGVFDRFTAGLSDVLGMSLSNEGLIKSEEQKNNSSGNLTEIFAGLIANKIIEGNPDGSQSIDGEESLVLPGNLDLSDPNLQDKMYAFKEQILSPEINENKLNIIITNNKEDLTGYISSLHISYGEIISRSRINVSAASFSDVLKINKSIGDIYREYTSFLYKVEVPGVFKDFHKKILSASEAQVLITDALTKYSSDPLRASMVGELQKSLNFKYVELAKEEIDLVKKYDLPVDLKILIPNQ